MHLLLSAMPPRGHSTGPTRAILAGWHRGCRTDSGTLLMQSLALVVHVILAAVVIGLVLIQHGKGADAGAAFGSGASATVFGARGAGSFLSRATTIAAALFFLTSLLLFWMAAHRESGVRSVTDIPGADIPGAVEEAPSVVDDLPGGVTEINPDGATDIPAAPTE